MKLAVISGFNYSLICSGRLLEGDTLDVRCINCLFKMLTNIGIMTPIMNFILEVL